ncbi:MAG TPA: hypothetical protein VMV26_06680 [Alphaproteobacteria bacterium]|nr:hypothetical protein [Alphaproteobacteria bacterium]
MAEEMESATLELIERRLTDNITKSVRTRLFAVYVSIGVAVGAVLSYAGLNVVADIKRDVEQDIAKSLEQQIAKAKASADDARTELQVQFQVSNELAKRAGKTFDELDSKLAEFRPKMDTLNSLGSKLTDVGAKMTEVQSTVVELELKGRNLQSSLYTASQNIGSLTELSGKVEALAKQISELSQLATRSSPAADTKGYADIVRETNQIAASSAAVSRSIQQAKKATLVWFQFYPADKSMADAIADTLKAKGFRVPTPEAKAQSLDLYEIRYYYDNDRARAEELARAVAQAVSAANPQETRQPKIADLTKWTKAKPDEGTLELWYGSKS